MGRTAKKWDRRIRVAEILEPVVGGTKRHVLDILTGLDPERFDFTLIYSAERDRAFRSVAEELTAAGVRCVEVPMTRAPRPAMDLRAFRRILNVFETGRFDVVHAHASKAGLLARAAAWLAGVRRVVYTPHVYHFATRRGAARALYWTPEWLAAQVTSRVVAVCEGQARAMARSGVARPEQIVVIENGVRVADFEGLGRATARRGLALPRFAPVVAMLARLAPRKGVDVFLRMAAHVLRSAPNVRFLVAGDGPERERLEAMRDALGLRGAVDILGQFSDPRPLYAAADVVALTSEHEGLPYALIEAMAAARAVVATDAPGNRDAVVHGDTGLLAPVGDAVALADHVLRLLGDARQRDAMGRRGRERVERRFTLERFLSRTAALLEGHAVRH